MGGETNLEVRVERLTIGEELTVPEPDPYFATPAWIKSFLAQVERLSKKHPVNLLITGPQGCGKTSLARQFASRYNRPFISIECGFLQEPQQWFGRLDLQEIRTVYLESIFIRAVETPQCVICLDEINRVENERVLNVLTAFLDERRQAYVDDLRRVVKVADGVVFFATLNEGPYFVGVGRLDAALRDRFREIRLHFLPPEVEADVLVKKTKIPRSKAEILAYFAASVRQDKAMEKKISTRQLLMIAEDIALGSPIKRATLTAIGHSHDTLWQQRVLEHLHIFLKKEELLEEETGYVYL